MTSSRTSTEIYDGDDYLIETPRLGLHAVQPHEYEILALDRADPTLWIDRGFANPHQHLVDDAGPLPHRIPRIRAQPELAKYLLRMVVLRDLGEIIGSAGFHAAPDESGMIEIGLGIVPACQGQGYAQEALRGMWDWVAADPLVQTLRYTVGPENGPSQAIIKKFGFHYVGQQIDEEDGPEDIFEMTVDEYQRKFDLS